MLVNHSLWYKLNGSKNAAKLKKVLSKEISKTFLTIFCPTFEKRDEESKQITFTVVWNSLEMVAMWKISFYVKHFHIFALHLEKIRGEQPLKPETSNLRFSKWLFWKPEHEKQTLWKFLITINYTWIIKAW